MARLPFSRQRASRSAQQTFALFLLRSLLFLALALVFYYVVRKQEQRFLEVRVPTGVLRPS